MGATNPNSPEILCDEILADARRESEEILGRARQEAGALLARAAAEAEQIRHEHLAQAQDEAVRRRELILATVAVEAGRLRAARIETQLQSIREATRQKLQSRDGFDYGATIVALAADALNRMTGDTFVVKLAPADRAIFGDRLAEEIAQRIGRPSTITIADEPATRDGGPIIQDREGRQIWDNRFQSRLERLWPELRRQIAIATSLVAQRGSSDIATISEPQNAVPDQPSAGEPLAVRQSSGAFEFAVAVPNAAEGCQGPKAGGSSDGLGKGDT